MRAVVATAYAHCAGGGVALFLPDYVAESFEPGLETGGGDGDGRGARFLAWRWDPDPGDSTYVADLAYLLRREGGAVEAVHDRHVLGLFPRAVWLELLATAGFRPLETTLGHGHGGAAGRDAFLGLRPAAARPARDEAS